MYIKIENGITLVALVISIIILLILAGITMFMLGEHGIIKKAEQAGKDYKQAEANEQKDLEELYSSIRVAEDSKVTLTMKELDTYINQKVEEKLNASSNIKPTGIKKDTYIFAQSTNAGMYENITSMQGLSTQMDPNNKMTEYLSWSDTDGYTVLKSRLVFCRLKISGSSNIFY